MSRRAAGPLGSNCLLLLLCLGVLLTLVGCTAAPLGEPTEQGRPVTLGLINSANETHTFEVSVVSGPLTETTLHKANGETTSVSPGPGLSSYQFNEERSPITSIGLPDSARSVGRTTLEPGETFERPIEELPQNPVVVVSVKNDERIFALVAAACDGTLVYVEVQSRDGGSTSAYNCQGGGGFLQL